MLEAAGIVPSGQQLQQRERRANTQALYTQRKFNLFREENEGFSKLIVDLNRDRNGVPMDAACADQIVEEVIALIGMYPFSSCLHL